MRVGVRVRGQDEGWGSGQGLGRLQEAAQQSTPLRIGQRGVGREEDLRVAQPRAAETLER